MKINWKMVGIFFAAFLVPFGHTIMAAYYIRKWYMRKKGQCNVNTQKAS